MDEMPYYARVRVFGHEITRDLEEFRVFLWARAELRKLSE